MRSEQSNSFGVRDMFRLSWNRSVASSWKHCRHRVRLTVGEPDERGRGVWFLITFLWSANASIAATLTFFHWNTVLSPHFAHVRGQEGCSLLNSSLMTESRFRTRADTLPGVSAPRRLWRSCPDGVHCQLGALRPWLGLRCSHNSRRFNPAVCSRRTRQTRVQAMRHRRRLSLHKRSCSPSGLPHPTYEKPEELFKLREAS